MSYIGTRGEAAVSGAQAILKGLAPAGGLYVPTEIQMADISAWQGLPYEAVALEVLKRFLPDYDEGVLKDAIEKSYGQNFGGKAGETVKVADGLYSLELWHGPTAAFKDYALQLMPKLLVEARRMLDEKTETLILVATSGDTGSAALAGYKDLDGIKITVFYPDRGTSEIQRLQMATQEGGNVAVYAVDGNFDDAQRGVKAAFSDSRLAEELKGQGKSLSSANSINWGRLLPQIVYYITSYLTLCGRGEISYGEGIDYCVPTGNFGDIMAGYYAKAMGLPIARLVCASNQNNVLADFLQSGTYDTHREFYKTSSPSMDILVSSNLERLLYHECGDTGKVQGWMRELAENGRYTVDEETLAGIRETFAGGWVDEECVEAKIQELFEEKNYLCDPHTAVAFCVAEERKSERPCVVLSTANPYKFCGKVLRALGQAVPEDEFDALRRLEEVTGVKAPVALSGLQGKTVRFDQCVEPAAIPEIPLTL